MKIAEWQQLICLLGPSGLGAYILLCVAYRVLGTRCFEHFILPCTMYIETHCVVVGHVFHILWRDCKLPFGFRSSRYVYMILGTSVWGLAIAVVRVLPAVPRL